MAFLELKNKAKRPFSLISNQSGNIFFTLFGAVAIVGLLGTAIVSTMRGPLSTMVQVQARTQAESEMAIASRLALMEATELANNGDCDGDGFVEPLEYKDAGGAGPTGGGFLPDAVASAKIDPWGTNYGYCTWDAGLTTGAIACDTDSSTTNERLDGNGSGTDETYTVIAVISAGADQVFDTACTGGATPSVSKGGDDIVVQYTYATANAASDGLWNVKSGDSTVAQINKNLEVTGGASFTGGLDLTASSAALTLGAASLLFPDEGTLSSCNAANDGLIRINKSTDPDTMEMCDDPTGWVPVGSSIWQLGAGNDVYYNTGSYEVGIGTSTPSEALDVVGNIRATGSLTGATLSTSGNGAIGGTLGVTGTSNLGVLNASGAVDFSSTLNADGAATLGSTLGVTGATTLSSTLDAQGDISDSAGDLTIDDNLVVTGTTDAQGNISNSTDDLTLDDDTVVTGSTDLRGAVINSTGAIDLDDNVDVSGTLDVTGVGTALTVTNNADIGGTLEAADYTYNGNDFTPSACGSGSFNRWDGDSWECETDTAGGGGGTVTSSDIEKVLNNGSDANGEGLEDLGVTVIGANAATGDLSLDVEGKIGATQYCLNDNTQCFTTDQMNQSISEVLGVGNNAGGSLDLLNLGGLALGSATISNSINLDLMLDVTGDVGAIEYCDAAGANCFTAASVATLVGGAVTEIDDLSDAYHDISTDFDGDLTNNDDNLFIGHEAASLVATVDPNKGARNTAIGATALDALTVGDDNIAIGFNAGGSITNVEASIAIGSNALGNGNSGSSVAIGRSALRNASGNNNIAIGTSAGNQITNGISNVAIGNNAMQQTRSSSNSNVVIGSNALSGVNDSTTIVARTVALGFAAGQNITTGSNNIFLGYQAGDLNSSGSDNIIIGYNVDPSLATASQELNIGNILFGKLDDQSTTPAVEGGQIGIGVTDASAINAKAALEVNGTNLGFLPPRNTDPNTNIGTASTPAGLIAYDSTDNQLQYYNGTAWISLAGLGSGSFLDRIEDTGDGNTSIDVDVGDADANDTIVFTNAGTQSMMIDANSQVGIGTVADPLTALHISDTSYTFTGGGLSFGDGDSGFFERADDELVGYINGNNRHIFASSYYQIAQNTVPRMQAVAAGSPTYMADKDFLGTGMGKTTGSAGNDVTLFTNSGHRLTIDSVGRTIISDNNSYDPNDSAILDLTSITKGFLAPRMSTADRAAIATPANGLTVFDTDEDAYYYYDLDDTVWRALLGSGGGGSADAAYELADRPEAPETTPDTTIEVDTAGDGSANTIVFTNDGTTSLVLTADGDLVMGDTVIGEGSKMFYDSSKRALRIGQTQVSSPSNYWNDPNVGSDSLAVGTDMRVSGSNSVGFGSNSIVEGNSSFAVGDYSHALGLNTAALGTNARALGSFSQAFGTNGAEAYGYQSMAFGQNIQVGSDTPQTDSSNTTVGNFSIGFGLGPLSGFPFVYPRITGDNTFGVFTSASDGYDLSDSNTIGFITSKILIDSEPSTAASKGCIRYNDGTDKLEFSNDCIAYSEILGSASVPLQDRIQDTGNDTFIDVDSDGTGANNTIVLTNNGSQSMIIDAAGQVGIGTMADPTTKFQVVGADDTDEVVSFLSGTDNGADGDTSMRVGIGTATPQTSLQLSGNLLLGSETTCDANTYGALRLTGERLEMCVTDSDGGGTDGYITIAGSGAGDDGDWLLETGVDVSTGLNVGIGTTIPQQKLDVADLLLDVGTGNCAAGYTEVDYDGNGGAANMDCVKHTLTVDQTNGRVGIGIGAPTAGLHINATSSATATLLIDGDAANQDATITLKRANGTEYRIHNDTGPGGLHIRNNTNGRLMSFRDNNNIGITEDNPDRRFHIRFDSPTETDVAYPVRITAENDGTGTIAAGIGAGMEFEVETVDDNNEIGATIEAVTTDVTAGAENFDLVFKTMAGGAAAAEAMRITGDNATRFTFNANDSITLLSGGFTHPQISFNSHGKRASILVPEGTGSLRLFTGTGSVPQLSLAPDNAGVGIGIESPDASALLQVNSTTRGFLPPRMTTTQRTTDMVTAYTAAGIADGLIVYDTDLDALFVYDLDDTSWRELAASGGPTDADWVIDSANNRVYNAADNIGIGTSIPQQKLDVADLLLDEGTGNCAAGYIEVDYDGNGGAANMDCVRHSLTVSAANGQVGIGTANPDSPYMLHIEDQSTDAGLLPYVLLDGDAANTDPMFVMKRSNGGVMAMHYDAAPAGLHFRSGISGTRMVSIDDSTGNLGVGVSVPTRRLHLVRDNSVANAVEYLMRMTKETNGTPVAGIGVGMEFEAETSASNNEVGAIIEAVTTDVTATSEDFDLVFKTMTAGAAAAEAMRLTSAGNLQFPNNGTGIILRPGSAGNRVNMISEGSALKIQVGTSAGDDYNFGDTQAAFFQPLRIDNASGGVDASALLQVNSTTRGFLAPRMSTTDRNAIASPAEGLLVFDTTLDNFYFYDATSTSWLAVGGDATAAGADTQIQFNTGNALDASSDLTFNDTSDVLSVNGTVSAATKVNIGSTTGAAAPSYPTLAGDNLGNHTATQNIVLGSNYINGDGDNEGVLVNSNGQLRIETSSAAGDSFVIQDTSRPATRFVVQQDGVTTIRVNDGSSALQQFSFTTPGGDGALAFTRNGNTLRLRMDTNELFNIGYDGQETSGIYIDRDRGVGVGAADVDVSALFQIDSTSKGFLPPRLAGTGSVTAPAEGLMIYDESDNTMKFNSGTSGSPVWTAMTASGSYTDRIQDGDNDTWVDVDDSGSDLIQLKPGTISGTNTGLWVGGSGNDTNIRIGNNATPAYSVLEFGQGGYGGQIYGGISASNTGANGMSIFTGANSNHLMRFVTNSTERIRINSAGQVGIGTVAATDSLLDISGAAADGDYIVDIQNTTSSGEFMQMIGHDGSDSIKFNQTTGGSGFITVHNDLGTGTIALDGEGDSNQGKIGIGTITPNAHLHVLGTASDADYLIDVRNNTENGDFMQMIAHDGNSSIVFSQGAGGNGLLTLHDDAGTANITLDAEDGNISYAGVMTDTSDIRLKTDIKPLLTDDIITKIAAIDTYSFKMKSNPNGPTEFGVMAQELEKIFPELVMTANDEMGTKSVNYIGLIAPMIEATKALKSENDSLRSEIATLKAQQNDIVKQVLALQLHTGYGVSKAGMTIGMILLMMLFGGAMIFVIRRNQQSN